MSGKKSDDILSRFDQYTSMIHGYYYYYYYYYYYTKSRGNWLAA